MAFQAFIYNNTPFTAKVSIMGPQTEARFILAGNTVAPLQLSNGYKALVAFANDALFAMRPIRATAQNQVFSVNPNPVPGGPVVTVYSEAEPEQVDLNGIPQAGAVVEQPLLQEFGPGN